MTSSVKISGFYRDAAPYAKVGGAWKRSKEAWVKVDGAWKQFFLAGGIPDPSFNILDNSDTTPNQFDTSVTDIAVQADGKILAVGSFNYLYGTSGTLTKSLARINTDNTADVSFSNNIANNFNGAANCVTVQSDGKILVGGQFTTFAGVTVNRIIRLNSDGTRDTTFTTNTGTGPNSTVQDITVQSDGKIILVGNFTTFNAVTVNRIVRLNSDGTRDTTFTTNAGTAFSGNTSKVVVQSDGKILVSGTFATFAGVTVNNFVRLNANGTRDTAFTTSLGTGFTAASGTPFTNGIALQSDGKILVGGYFQIVNGVQTLSLVRLNSNGTTDTAFYENTEALLGIANDVTSIVIQPDNKILVIGFFTDYINNPPGTNNPSDPTTTGVVRLNSDGTRDDDFFYKIGTGLNSTGMAALITTDSKIVIAGLFSKFNGSTVSHFIKLDLDGTRNWPPRRLGIDGIVTSIAVQSDEKIILAGNFTAFNETAVHDIIRINKNGTLDTSFNAKTASGPAASDLINSIALQSDGKIIVGGSFTTFRQAAGRNRLVRVNSDGTEDMTFKTNIGTAVDQGFPGDETVRSVVVQPDQKILVGGNFTSFNGIATKNLIRLNSDGTRDTAFMTNLGTGFTNSVFVGSDRVSSITVQSDNSILVAGLFNSLNGTVVRNIVRLNQDGTRQASFTTNIGTGADQEILAVTTKPNGKIVIAGQFGSFNGHTISKVAQLNSDGTRDTSFNPGSGTSFLIYSVAAQENNKIIIGGQFTSFSGSDAKGFARLNEDGSYDSTFNAESAEGTLSRDIRAIVISPDKKILIGGTFLSQPKLLKNSIARIGSDSTG